MDKITEIFDDESGIRLDVFVAEVSDISRSRAAKLMENGLVLVNGAAVSKNTKPKTNDISAIILEN